MRVKDCSGFKAVGFEGEGTDGQFEAMVSVFNVVDRDGDVVLPGAFTESLNAWKASGDPIPILWSHRMDDPRYSIGAVLEVAELGSNDPRLPDWVDDRVKANGGLWVRGQLHVGSDAGEVATAARKLLLARLVKQFSYAYEVQESEWLDEEGVRILKRLDIFEISPTQVGANDLTQLLGAKGAGAERGSELTLVVKGDVSGDLQQAVVALLDRPGNAASDGGNSEGGTAKGEEPPEGVKPEEPAQLDAATVRLLCEGQRISLDL